MKCISCSRDSILMCSSVFSPVVRIVYINPVKSQVKSASCTNIYIAFSQIGLVMSVECRV